MPQFPLWNMHRDWELEHLLGKRWTCFWGEMIIPGRNKKWCVPTIPLKLWECIPVLVFKITCQSHPHRLSVLLETLLSLGSHDPCLFCLPPVLTFAPFSPLQAHYWLWNDGSPSQVSSHFCWLAPIYHTNIILTISSLVKGLSCSPWLIKPPCGLNVCVPTKLIFEALTSNVMVFGGVWEHN